MLTLYGYNPAEKNYTTLSPNLNASFAPAAAYLNGKIYKIGGYTTGSQPSSAVEVYDTASNLLTALSNYPSSVGWAAAWAHGNFVYGAAGVGILPGSDTEKTYRYDPITNTWDDAAIADLPEGRWGSALGVYNGFTILAGSGVGGISEFSFVG